MYNKDVTEILAVPGGKDMTDFKFPKSVVRIGEAAFYQCTNEAFTEIAIPDRVTVLGEGAFKNCCYLKRVVLGKGITAISDAAFMLCDGLCQVVIRGKLKVIGANAFTFCDDLAEIDIPESVIEIGELAFKNCRCLKNIMIPKNVTRIGYDAFGFRDDGKYPDVYITGNRGTVAYHYAQKRYIAFQDADTGEMLKFDMLPLSMQRIKKLTAGKKKIKLAYEKVDGATYEIAVKEAGATGWKMYSVAKSSATVKGLRSGKQYEVRVRTLCDIGGERYDGNWSEKQKIVVR